MYTGLFSVSVIYHGRICLGSKLWLHFELMKNKLPVFLQKAGFKGVSNQFKLTRIAVPLASIGGV